MALTYEEGKKIFLKTILVLAAITVVEVIIALLAKGYLIKGVHLPHILTGGAMVILSAYKAYLIIFEFMHVKYEVKGLMRSILMPTVLLIWAVIAFLWDGTHWKERREIDGVKMTFEVPQNEHHHDDALPLDHGDHHEHDDAHQDSH